MKSANTLLRNSEFVIPNEVREVGILSFLGILIEEGILASLGMTAKSVFQQPDKRPKALHMLPRHSMHQPGRGTGHDLRLNRLPEYRLLGYLEINHAHKHG